MACLPIRRAVLAILTPARACRSGASCMAAIRCSRAFCLVLRAFGPCRIQASSRRRAPRNLAALATSEASSSARWVR